MGALAAHRAQSRGADEHSFRGAPGPWRLSVETFSPSAEPPFRAPFRPRRGRGPHEASGAPLFFGMGGPARRCPVALSWRPPKSVAKRCLVHGVAASEPKSMGAC